jgi:preprotein translocase subunit SecE
VRDGATGLHVDLDAPFCHRHDDPVSGELKKVTWPTPKEVRTATVVVLVMSIISALILGLFDFVWSNLTELVYG